MSLSRRRFLAASAVVPLFAPSLALAQAKEFRLGLITPNGHSWNKAALKLGATTEEIMDVLKICVAQGAEACNLGVPLLAEELARLEQKTRA